MLLVYMIDIDVKYDNIFFKYIIKVIHNTQPDNVCHCITTRLLSQIIYNYNLKNNE